MQRIPKIAIYTGKGSSYSWIWLAETFDKFSLFNVNFIDKIENLNSYDILIVPGGDTFALAEGIGKEKLQEIKIAIENGLIYFGICAGAYLPLKTSLTPLSWFNLVNAKISNISSSIENFDKNYTVPYGCSFVFHPIRDEVVVKIVSDENNSENEVCSETHSSKKTDNLAKFVQNKVCSENNVVPKSMSSHSLSQNDVCSENHAIPKLMSSNKIKEKTLKVPLFGGPIIKNCEDEIIAVYENFTEKTLFLTTKELAEKIVIGKIAVMKKNYGKGKLYLFAPHFEHPNYENANKFFIEKIYESLDGKKENWQKISDEREIDLENKPKNAFENSNVEIKDKIQFFKNELSLNKSNGKIVIKNSNKFFVSLSKNGLSMFNNFQKNSEKNYCNQKELKRELSKARLLANSLDNINWKIGIKNWDSEKASYFLVGILKRIKNVEKVNENCLENAKRVVEILKEIKKNAKEGKDTTILADEMLILLSKIASSFFNCYFSQKSQ